MVGKEESLSTLLSRLGHSLPDSLLSLVRITSYNVCYTKLLREGVVQDSCQEGEGELDDTDEQPGLPLVE